MRRTSAVFLAGIALALLAAAPAGAQRPAIILATTTSTHDSGLLDDFVPRFERESGIGIKVTAAGTGAALRMAARGDADAVLVHAPEREDEARRFLAFHVPAPMQQAIGEFRRSELGEPLFVPDALPVGSR